MDHYRVTKEGFAQLEKKLKEKKEKLVRLLAKTHETAEECGDYWHDNPALYQLEMEEGVLQRQISEISDKFRKAMVIEEEDVTKEVKIGSFVTITFKKGGSKNEEEMKFTIVDPEMSDPINGLISYDSPLGKAILGALPGDIRTYSIGEEKFQIKLVKVGMEKDGQK